MSTKVLFLTLVHPDFLPPVYASAQVLAKKKYEVDIYTFESTAPGNFNAGDNVRISVLAKHSGSSSERVAARNKFSESTAAYIQKESPVCIVSFCEFSYLTALKYSKGVPVFHFALELTDFSILNLFRSPLGAIRTWKAVHQLNKANYLCTPSYERSGWLAGRYRLNTIPDTVHNTPFLPDNFQFKKIQDLSLLPESFKNKVKVLHTGGVNFTRSVKELIVGFEKTESDTCLIITNIGNSEYSNEIKEYVSKSNRKDDILLLGTVSRDELIALQSNSHIGVCLMKLKNGFDSRMIAPNKVGEYFYSGLLVLGMNTPYFHQFLPYKITELVSDLEPDSVARGLSNLRKTVLQNDYQANVLTCLKDWYNMERQMESALSVLKSYE